MRSELVGRDRELDALERWSAAALGGDARLVLCHGEPGVGKTRLVEELAARAATRGVPTVWGRAAEADGAPPYWPWRQVLRAVPDVDRLAAALGVTAELAALAPEPPATGGTPGAEDRFRLFDAVSRVLGAAAAGPGLVVVLDDAHWADRPSLLLLRHLARSLRGSRLLVLATYRAGADAFGETLAELVREPTTERLELTGLGRDAVADQLGAAVGEPVAAELVGRVHELTGGNPFFVGELARHIAGGRGVGIPRACGT